MRPDDTPTSLPLPRAAWYREPDRFVLLGTSGEILAEVKRHRWVSWRVRVHGVLVEDVTVGGWEAAMRLAEEKLRVMTESEPEEFGTETPPEDHDAPERP